MTISETIIELIKMMKEHGDIDVYVQSEDFEVSLSDVDYLEGYTDAYSDVYPNRILLS